MGLLRIYHAALFFHSFMSNTIDNNTTPPPTTTTTGEQQHASSSSSSSRLTEEQRKRIEENKAKALEKLKAKRQREEQESKRPKRARWTKYYEYDLSTMVDTKGGFMIEETREDKLIKSRREEATKISPFIRMSLCRIQCMDTSSMTLYSNVV